MDKIKNIIFDLGGVIINLDVPKTINSFVNLGFTNFSSLYTQANQISAFDAFDKGTISPNDFFKELKNVLNTDIDRKELITAWNAMLLDFPEHRLRVLQQIKKQYRTFLLSNTNETHVTAFEQILQQQHGISNLNNYFEKVYYSCRVKMRKPDSEIFKHVLSENNLIAEETVFIDDSEQHIKGALKLGIQAFLLDKEKDIVVLLKELKLLL